MRVFNPLKTLNENIVVEILAAMLESKIKANHLLSLNIENKNKQIKFNQYVTDLDSKAAEIVNSYYTDLKNVMLGKFAVNTEQTNAIHIGKFQKQTLIDFLIIEGSIVGTQEILSVGRYTDMKDLTHDGILGEMKFLTQDFIFDSIKDNTLSMNDDGLNPDWDIIHYFDHLTRYFLFKAIDKLNNEHIFDLTFKNRPFYFYYGEPNYHYYTVYCLN